MGLIEKLDLDRRAVERLRRLRTKYGSGPVWIRNPMGPQLLVLSADQAEEILACTPTPYSPASNEKTASLAHFEPHVSLISAGSERAARRRFNEQILDSRNSRHRLAERFREIATEEMGKSVQSAAANAEFQWDGFAASWNRIVRRIVLGDSARDDAGLTDMLARLRRNANLAFAYPRNRTLQARLIARVGDYIDRGEQGSLAELIAASFDGVTQPVHQALHWLFAFEPAESAPSARWPCLRCMMRSCRARGLKPGRVRPRSGQICRSCGPVSRTCCGCGRPRRCCSGKPRGRWCWELRRFPPTLESSSLRRFFIGTVNDCRTQTV
jgi:hypothetical protein